MHANQVAAVADQHLVPLWRETTKSATTLEMQVVLTAF